MKDFKKAEEIIKEYRKLRLNKKTKDEFDLHKKLAKLGYTEQQFIAERDDRYLKSLEMQVDYCDVDNTVEKITEHIISSKPSVLLAIPTKPAVYVGKDEFNRKYCIENNIPILQLGYSGGTIVEGNGDLGIAIFLKKAMNLRFFQEKISEWIGDCKIAGNDILVNGNKVVGGAILKKGDKTIYYFQVSFSVDLNLIENICSKEMKKIPKGLSEFGTKTREELIEEVQSWLQ